MLSGKYSPIWAMMAKSTFPNPLTLSHQMKTPTYNTPFTVSEGSHLRYIAVKDAFGKQVARVPWGHQDNDLAQLFALAPEMLEALSSIVSAYQPFSETEIARSHSVSTMLYVRKARAVLSKLSRATA